MTLALAFLAVCLIYAVAFVSAWRLTTSGRLDPPDLLQARRQLADPLTARFQRWQGRAKMDSNVEELRAKALEMMKRQSNGTA